MKKKILLFEFIIIVVLVFLMFYYKINIKSEIFKEKFENYNEYINKYEVDNGDLYIYEIIGIYDPNTNLSYYKISILNNTDNIINVKKIKISYINKKTKKQEILEYLFETDLSPNDYINFSYEYSGDLHEDKYYKVIYELN